MLFVEVSWPQSNGVCSQVHGLLSANNERKNRNFVIHIPYFMSRYTHLAELGAIIGKIILTAHQHDATFEPFLTQSLGTGDCGRS